jgi:type IV pilus assembly protein PilC
MAVLINANIPLVRALETVQHQTSHLRMKQLVSSLISYIKQGYDFSTSLYNFPSVFDQLYIQLIKVGESSANLGIILSLQADYLEKIYHLRKKVSLALIYPLILIVSSIIAISFFISFIFPAVAEIFSDFGAKLPFSVTWILALGKALPILVFVIFILFCITIPVLHFSGWLKILRIKYHRFVINTPYLGYILKRIFVSRFCRSLGILIKSKNSLSHSLSVCISITKNTFIKKQLEPCLNYIGKGKSLSLALRNTKLFPDMVSEMLTVGEETAKLDEVLLYVADYYEKDLDTLADTISSLIEPIIIVVVGLFISIIIISLYIPLFDLVNVINY